MEYSYYTKEHIELEEYLANKFSVKSSGVSCLVKKREEPKEERVIINNKEYYFLTINPNPDITLQDFLKTINKALNKVWITSYIYVIEQRGETLDDVGKGFHLHAIFKKNIKHCKVVSGLSNSFKKMCDTSNYHFFNIKNIDENEKDRKMEYILGKKADEEKHKKQQMDIIFRQNNNLKSYYILNMLEDAPKNEENEDIQKTIVSQADSIS